MLELWNAYGFYLWAMTTALVLIALAWLAYNTFVSQPEEEEVEAAAPNADATSVQALTEQVHALAEAAPHMQATLGRSLQYCGLVRYPDAGGAQAFSLAISDARGDGFVLSSSMRGGMSAKPLSQWGASQALSHEEQAAVDQARGVHSES